MAFYPYKRRVRGLYVPHSETPFRMSRSKIDLFLECARCFYLDRRLGVGRPAGFPFTLNSAVDALLKKEFDLHRTAGTRHPLMEKHGVGAVPYAHKEMDFWRDALSGGIQFLHRPTGFLVTGGIDDVWVNPATGELIIVDYKATSKSGEVSINADWQISYKRQMEVYQWLFRQNNFNVSRTGYFVYCNGDADKEAFNNTLEFSISLIPYEGNTGWIEKTLLDIKKTLDGDLPDAASDCEYCGYRKEAQRATEESVKEKPALRESVRKEERKRGQETLF